jgi:hypothetical protein
LTPQSNNLYSSYIDIFSNGKKTAIDWTALSKNQDNMVDPEYLPAGFKFHDPSKMKKVRYQALLEHWYECQQNVRIDTALEFKGYWDLSSESVLNASNGHISHRSQPKPKLANQGVTRNTGTSIH